MTKSFHVPCTIDHVPDMASFADYIDSKASGFCPTMVNGQWSMVNEAGGCP